MVGAFTTSECLRFGLNDTGVAFFYCRSVNVVILVYSTTTDEGYDFYSNCYFLSRASNQKIRETKQLSKSVTTKGSTYLKRD